MKLRKLIFWTHLIAGLAAGVVILIMSVTGVLLSFERQISAWVHTPKIKSANPEQFLQPSALVGKVFASGTNSSAPTITWNSAPGQPVIFSFGRERTVFVDPSTGEILGEGSKSLRTFFQKVTDLHRWLALSGPNRSAGKGVTGAANLVFLFLVVSGFYLWWPRNWKLLKTVTFLGTRLKGKARDWNWHNVIGFWSLIPLFFIIITGALISYPWATALLYRMTGNEPPQQRDNTRGPTPQSTRSGSETRNSGSEQGRPAQTFSFANVETLDGAWTKASLAMPTWKIISLRVPEKENTPLNFTIDGAKRGRPDLRKQISIDRKTGEILSEESFASYNLGRKLRTLGRWVHTGEAGGIVGQVIAALASAGAVLLVWTGFSLALRRFFNRKNSLLNEHRIS